MSFLTVKERQKDLQNRHQYPLSITNRLQNVPWDDFSNFKFPNKKSHLEPDPLYTTDGLAQRLLLRMIWTMVACKLAHTSIKRRT